jgi:hypothetical protein
MGELAGLGVPQTEFAPHIQAMVQQAPQHGRPSMALKLDHVFAGVGMGPWALASGWSRVAASGSSSLAACWASSRPWG